MSQQPSALGRSQRGGTLLALSHSPILIQRDLLAFLNFRPAVPIRARAVVSEPDHPTIWPIQEAGRHQAGRPASSSPWSICAFVAPPLPSKGVLGEWSDPSFLHSRSLAKGPKSGIISDTLDALPRSAFNAPSSQRPSRHR